MAFGYFSRRFAVTSRKPVLAALCALLLASAVQPSVSYAQSRRSGGGQSRPSGGGRAVAPRQAVVAGSSYRGYYRPYYRPYYRSYYYGPSLYGGFYGGY